MRHASVEGEDTPARVGKPIKAVTVARTSGVFTVRRCRHRVLVRQTFQVAVHR